MATKNKSENSPAPVKKNHLVAAHQIAQSNASEVTPAALLARILALEEKAAK